MPDFTGRRYWLIGASEGLGLALAHQLHAQGAELVLSARSAERLASAAAPLNAQAIPMDVCDSVSVERATEAVGDIDGVIYCAGAYDPMSAQDWDPERSVQIADVNFIGALRCLGSVVPAMVARNAGHVVVIGSLAGHRGLPGAIGYGASKAALMHLAENIAIDAPELLVQVINPGFIQTRLTRKNDFKMPQIMTPDTAAQQVLRAMRSGRFETNFPKPFSWVFVVGRLLPRRLFRALF